MVKKILIKLSVIVVTVFCCILILEAGLRFVGQAPTSSEMGINMQHFDSYRLRRNVSKVIRCACLFLYNSNKFLRISRQDDGHKRHL